MLKKRKFPATFMLFWLIPLCMIFAATSPAFATVNPVTSIVFSADRTEITSGESVTLTWDASGSTQVSLHENDDLTLSNVVSVLNRPYEIVSDGLVPGALCYTDRDYRYPEVPAFLMYADYIKTSNRDMGVNGRTELFSFDMSADSTIYIALDVRASTLPSWMDGFTDTGYNLYTYGSMNVYAKDFSAGHVVHDHLIFYKNV